MGVCGDFVLEGLSRWDADRGLVGLEELEEEEQVVAGISICWDSAIRVLLVILLMALR